MGADGELKATPQARASKGPGKSGKGFERGKSSASLRRGMSGREDMLDARDVSRGPSAGRRALTAEDKLRAFQNPKNVTFNSRNRKYQESRMRGGFASMDPGEKISGGMADQGIDD